MFSLTGDLVKSPHVGSILISICEHVDEVSVIHYLLTPINIFYHELSFILQRPL